MFLGILVFSFISFVFSFIGIFQGEERCYDFYEDSRLEPMVRHLNPLFWVEVLEKGRDYLPGTSNLSDLLSGLVEELNTLPETEQFLELLE